MKNIALIEKLEQQNNLTDEELIALLDTITPEEAEVLWERARFVREREYGKDVYIRGLIEFSNICRNDCYYCGIRKSNEKAVRYRLTPEEIQLCAREGYELGFRTFVLQGGEDAWFTKERVERIVKNLKREFPDCAVTLSVGERTREEYQCWFDAGADRYLLRHETADKTHYEELHPAIMKFDNRQKCLWDLKEIGYQVGAGFMVGAPGQKTEHLLKDLRFLQKLQPDMIGIGPFLSQQDTPFKDKPNGSVFRTLVLLGVLRLMFPKVLLPSTTALGTIIEKGREKGLLAGANVVMPNLSPMEVRKKYLLYDNKICTEEESAEGRELLDRQIEEIGYSVVVDIGNSRMSPLTESKS